MRFGSLVCFIWLMFFANTTMAASSLEESSTGITPLTNPGIMTPGQSIPTKKVSAGQISSLPSCPGDPSNPSVAQTKPICPDINGIYPPGGSAATCPNMCTVTTYPTGNNLPPNILIAYGECPANYIASVKYNSQPEYSYSSTTVTNYPQTVSDMRQLETLGYSCYRASGGGGSWTDSCNSGTGDNSSPRWINNTITDTIPGTTQVMFMYNAHIACATSGSDCNQKCFFGVGHCTIHCNIAGDYQWTYFYVPIVCVRPAGNYPTGQYVPASSVCVHVQPKWKELQKGG